MKKIVTLIFSTVLFCVFCTGAFAYTPQTEAGYFFAGDRYGISNIDTNGEIFVGVNQNKIAVSRDFESWDTLYQLDDVAAVQHLKGQFCAFTEGYTYVSADGEKWEKCQNNLLASPDADRIIKNKGSVVLFARDENNTYTGTYQTFDGISWKRVENIPDGIMMYHVNDMIMFESAGYMRGIYYSDTGEEFTHLTIDGYDDSAGPFRISCNGAEYVLYDYWRTVDGQTEENNLIYRYSSPDLINWTSEIIAKTHAGNTDTYGWIEPSGSIVSINGEWHAFSQNGYDMVFRDGEWVQGEYYGITGLNPSNPPFVYYNFTDYGIFLWSTNKNACFIDKKGETLHYDGSAHSVNSFYVKDGTFYGLAWTADGEFMWESENGSDWTKSDAAQELYKYRFSTQATNGSSSLESEIIERGSYRYRDGNKEITATLTESDGSAKTVSYEGTNSSDCVTVFGGNGYYIIGYHNGMQQYWVSHDGITRDELIELPGDTSNLYANSKNFFCNTQSGILHIGDMAQFESISALDAVKVNLNGEYLSFVQPPVIENSRTLVSMRFIFEKIGAKVSWSDNTKTAYVSYGENPENYIEIPINSHTALVNGEEKPLDTPARLINNKTMLPLRFIAEEMGFTVNYDKQTKTAEILN